MKIVMAIIFLLFQSVSGFGYHTERSCRMDAGVNALVQVEAGGTWLTTTSRKYFLNTGTILEGEYFYLYCLEAGKTMNYTCVVGCVGGEIDYQHCGPGGADGKGESFWADACVGMRETLLASQCVIDFESDDQVLSYSLDSQTFTQSWKEMWEIVYDYAATYSTSEIGKGWRDNGDYWVTHSDANLFPFGLVVGAASTRNTRDLSQGFYSAVVEDYYPNLCVASNNSLEGCGDGLKFSGYVDLLGPLSLLSVTSSTPVNMTSHDAPSRFTKSGFGADFEVRETNSDLVSGKTAWPGLNPEWECYRSSVPEAACNIATLAGEVVMAATPPTSYAFDQVTGVAYVTFFSYDPCYEYENNGHYPFFGLDQACYFAHSAGIHTGNGEQKTTFPILLDGQPDFFGVCSDEQMSKARWVSDINANFTGGLYSYDTGTEAAEDFLNLGGIHFYHPKFYDFRLCPDPADPYNPVPCIYNNFPGFENIHLDTTIIPSLLDFDRTHVTDHLNICDKHQRHYCPYDDYWITVDVQYDDAGADPVATVTRLRDFEDAMADCVNNGNCDP